MFARIFTRIRPLMHWVGGLIALLGVVYVGERLWGYLDQLSFDHLGSVIWILLFLLSLVYGLANLLLAFAWRDLLTHFNVSASASWVVWAYGVSQIGKYVPGNIFHLAGRQLLGTAAGYPQRILAVTTVWELGLLASVGSIFVLLILPAIVVGVEAWLSVPIFIVALICYFVAVFRMFGLYVSKAGCLYALFLLISSMVFVVVVRLVGDSLRLDVAHVVLLIGSFVVAWLVGLVTPGAPAGIGVRELVLVFLLNNNIPEANLVMAVALGRIVTAAGDLSFFVLASVYGRKLFFKG